MTLTELLIHGVARKTEELFSNCIRIVYDIFNTFVSNFFINFLTPNATRIDLSACKIQKFPGGGGGGACPQTPLVDQVFSSLQTL